MKNSFFSITILSFGILNLFCAAKADWTHWGFEGGGNKATELWFINKETNQRSLITTDCDLVADGNGGTECADWNGLSFDESIGKLVIEKRNKFFSYDVTNDSWENYDNSWKSPYDAVLKIPLIYRDENTGITKLGQNSLNFQEKQNELDLWGTNLTGDKVPINVTSGLLIKGRDVEQSINNVGALSAALTGLPTIPTETKLACGLGSGTHGGDFAFSGGCASKVNEKLSFNYAAAITMPGQEYAGDFEDKFSARAGFVWKLGKSTKPSQISLKEKKELEERIKILEVKNEKVISQNQSLLARLEKLENIAFDLQKNKDFSLSKSTSE